MQNIRNFAIIAHVDHGKSTLADRLLELTGTVGKDHRDQLLDRNPISRERGITIKLAPVRMRYQKYILNLIDTPGHVDFSYEVERTLACVEGAILLVDATQGVQAQTIAHTHKALEQDLVIIPVINKIDLPTANVESAKEELTRLLGVESKEILEISAKTGKGVEKLLERIIEKVPRCHTYSTLGVEKALIFDSYYDKHRGVIAFVRVFEGEIKSKDKLYLHASQSYFAADEVGVFKPELSQMQSLSAGEIGYVITKLKSIYLVQVGDTISSAKNCTPLPGYKKTSPMVFSSLFPTDAGDFLQLKKSLEKLSLNDSSLNYEPIYSKALGSGFRVGFLGLLHADVVRQRLESEYGLSIVLTYPTVEYRKKRKSGNLNLKSEYEEPIATVNIVTPKQYIGNVMKLCEDARGVFVHMDSGVHIYLTYEIPLAEFIRDFFDRLKSLSSGYASLQWEFKEYRAVKAGRLEILLNGELIDEFSEYVVAERSYERGQEITSSLKELIPRQQYEVKIQARYKGRVIASTRRAPLRKDVTAKLYGGDRTRKDKLLKKQKAGKKRMKHIGKVEIPKDVFLKVFRKSSKH